MSAARLGGYVVVFGVPRQVVGVPAVEVISPSVRLGGEGEPVSLLWSHDSNRVLAPQGRGLEIRRDGRGIFVFAHIPEPPRELLEALADNTPLGGSTAWRYADGCRAIWNVACSPWRREVTLAALREVSVTPRPAFASTSVRVLTHETEARWRRVWQPWVIPPLVTHPQPDVTIEGPKGHLLYREIAGLFAARGVEYDAWREHGAVQRAVAAHPAARTIAVRYARTVQSAQAVMNRRAAAAATTGGAR